MAAADAHGAAGAEGRPAAPAAGKQACERCGASFHCGAQDPTRCACTGLQLTPAHRAALRQHYRQCLCIGCLAAIAGGAPVAPVNAR